MLQSTNILIGESPPFMLLPEVAVGTDENSREMHEIHSEDGIVNEELENEWNVRVVRLK
jgi:hypothetical protein